MLESIKRFFRTSMPAAGDEKADPKDVRLAACALLLELAYADDHFSVLGPGWRSDRGRIYIQYGPPDQVESRPMNLDSAAYEIWTYIREGRRFVFVDYGGFGRYELYQPGR